MSVRCPQCAAPIQDPELRQCTFCGTALPGEELPAPSRTPSFAQLFAEVEHHPQLAAWRSHVPSSAAAVGRPALRLVAGLIFAAVAIGMISVALSMGAPGAFVLFLILFVFVGVGIAAVALFKLGRFSSAPLEHVPALVVDKRTHVAGGGGDSSAQTAYFATLERADGTRSECEVHGARYGEIAAGDYGLAYLRAGVLLDFKRVGNR